VPDVHLIVPAGSFNKRSQLWRHKKGLYLFKADNMDRVFRGKFVQAMAWHKQVIDYHPTHPKNGMLIVSMSVKVTREKELKR
jgi:hypothetical protein